MEIIQVFEPFYNATLELSGCKYVTISIVIPTFGCLQASLLVDPNDSLIVRVLKEVLNYWTNIYTDKYEIFTKKILIAATFLDVRTKIFGRFSDEIRKEFLTEAKNTIKTIISELTTEQKQVLKIVNLSNIPDSLNTFEASHQKVPTLKENLHSNNLILIRI
ncbi:hypothetical protein BpHYR1_009258 [Brachionus plicatilis]|uniref:Uncharacterized protein n=1 Tax=Brachionus plicatilis TaxID=10195 RepID=A0A3M7PUZ7_BRAPC|nr:hypothetical protein BpHYR1_009258 [Brachionus plicatilis]